MSRPLGTNKPPGYILPDWDFRISRVEICNTCEHSFITDANDNKEDIGRRLHCGECACSSWMMSGDVYVQRCPLGLWPIWDDATMGPNKDPNESGPLPV